MGENIGAVARVLSNFGFSELRLVAPRDGWPNPRANELAAGGEFIIESTTVYETLTDAVADLEYIVATSATSRDINKPLHTPKELPTQVPQGCKVGILLGRARSGLTNEEIAHSNCLVQITTSARNPSLNLAQAACIIAYEMQDVMATGAPLRNMFATRQEVEHMIEHLVERLEVASHFKVPEKRDKMVQNIRNIFSKSMLSSQEVQTIHGIIRSLDRGNN